MLIHKPGTVEMDWLSDEEEFLEFGPEFKWMSIDIISNIVTTIEYL